MKHIIIILLLLLMLPSCITYEKCVSKFGITGDTTYIPFERLIPRDSLITIIDIDSFPYFIPGDTHYIETPESRVKIKYWRDMYKNLLLIEAECPEIIIRDTIPCPPSTYLAPVLKWHQKAWAKWQEVSAYILIAAFLLLLFYLIFWKK